VCQKNAPVVNRLYNLIQEDPALAKDIKVLVISVADNKTRADDFKAKFKLLFPIFPDEKGEIYLTLNQPVIPSTMLITTGGKVLMNHNGLIENFDELLGKIKQILKKQ
jgi:peroxiredoxin